MAGTCFEWTGTLQHDLLIQPTNSCTIGTLNTGYAIGV